MSIATQSPTSSAPAADTPSFTEGGWNSLQNQPEASAYFHLSCEDAICDRINRSIDELDLPEFFTN